MPSESQWRLLLPAWVREIDADLVAILLWIVATNGAVFLPGLNETPLRIVFGLPFVLFAPGYALIGALFPEAGTAVTETETEEDGLLGISRESGIDGIERIALSFGTSIAVVPLLGLVLNFTPFGIRLAPIMVLTSAVTVLLTIIAVERRRQLPVEERFSVPYRTWVAAAREELFAPETRSDAALNVLLVMSLLLAVGSVGYAVAVPQQGESFTEFYLLTEDDGELVADNYPTEFTQGQSQSLIIGVKNNEHETVDYSVVVELQRVEIQNNSTIVLEDEQLTQFSSQVEHNRTWHTNQSLTPSFTGENLRLVFLLYKGGPPTDPTVESSYREVHLWVNVSTQAEPQNLAVRR